MRHYGRVYATLWAIHMVCSLLVVYILLHVLLTSMKKRANLVTLGIAACVASLITTPSDSTSITPTVRNRCHAVQVDRHEAPDEVGYVLDTKGGTRGRLAARIIQLRWSSKWDRSD